MSTPQKTAALDGTDLDAIFVAWSTLPTAMRAGIPGMIRTVQP
jgi:hypothetical protein